LPVFGVATDEEERPMTIRSILAIADGGATTQATLETAVATAKRFDAALDVLHVMADVNSVVPVIGEGMSGAMVEQLMSAMGQTIATRAARARDAYRKACTEPGAKISWRETTGREADVVAAVGRLTDLIVIGRPNGEAEAPLAATLDAALFDTGRPVLVASPTAARAIGGRVALAWNGSAQAARVVASALPILEAADHVSVLTVGTIDSAATAQDLIAYLARHDVRASHESVAAGGASTGAVLLAHAEQSRADLLVMGAYGHSRLREMILGGATRDVLSAATIPVLMAH
jgi:nucleotide-binding universal stress UspA family protein